MSNIVIPKVLLGFNYLVSRLWLVYILLSVFFIASVMISIFKKDFTWLSAFGGVMTIFGLLLTVSHSVPKTAEDINRYVESKFPESRDGINPEIVTNEQKAHIQKSRDTEATRILNCEASGLLITIIGTLIWAYIAFLNQVFWANG